MIRMLAFFLLGFVVSYLLTTIVPLIVKKAHEYDENENEDENDEEESQMIHDCPKCALPAEIIPISTQHMYLVQCLGNHENIPMREIYLYNKII